MNNICRKFALFGFRESPLFKFIKHQKLFKQAIWFILIQHHTSVDNFKRQNVQETK